MYFQVTDRFEIYLILGSTKIGIIFVFCIMVCNSLVAQNSAQVYKVKNGTNISKALSFKERYWFDEFRDGQVHFRNGKVSNAKLNYSLFYGEIQFISSLSDTLLLADNDYIDRIEIGGEKFYYQKKYGHVREKADYNNVKLVEKQFLANMGNEKYAAYEQYSATSAISSYSSFTNVNGLAQRLEGKDKVVLKRKSVFFLIDRNKRFYVASKENLTKIYPSRRKALKGFIKENNIKFETELDLRKVLQFSASL